MKYLRYLIFNLILLFPVTGNAGRIPLAVQLNSDISNRKIGVVFIKDTQAQYLYEVPQAQDGGVASLIMTAPMFATGDKRKNELDPFLKDINIHELLRYRLLNRLNSAYTNYLIIVDSPELASITNLPKVKKRANQNTIPTYDLTGINISGYDYIIVIYNALYGVNQWISFWSFPMKTMFGCQFELIDVSTMSVITKSGLDYHSVQRSLPYKTPDQLIQAGISSLYSPLEVAINTATYFISFKLFDKNLIETMFRSPFVKTEKTVIDTDLNIEWIIDVTDAGFPIKTAYTESLQEQIDSLVYDGKTGWRLPTTEELAKLYFPNARQCIYPYFPQRSGFYRTGEFTREDKSWNLYIKYKPYLYIEDYGVFNIMNLMLVRDI